MFQKSRLLCAGVGVFVALGWGSLRGQVWLDYTNVTDSNIVADLFLGANDPEEKDYVTGDFDLDGDIDLVAVRKLPFTTFGNRQNVLFINVDGVLIDMTGTYAPEFISAPPAFPDGDNARDVMTGNFDKNEWIDLVIANAGNQSSNGQQPRIFINLGEDASGNWLGFQEQASRLPFLISPAGEEPNACAVGVGDVTGNGVDDIYLVDYLNSLEDKLLINDGSGNFTEETDARLPGGFETSAFATAGAIADLNGDGLGDIIKNSTPSVTIAYNNPAAPGFFSVSQSLSVAAAYHFDVGDLNDDGKLDLYVVQDGQDQYQLNNSPVGAIPVSWTPTTLISSPLTSGFGGNAHIVDLDGDLDNDILCADVDTDVPGCLRRLAFLRNDGSIADPYAISPLIEAHHSGVYDVAAADFNNDGAMDIWVGHCAGTDLYFSNVVVPVPPVTAFVCQQVVGDVQLDWINNDTYESIEVRRSGVTIATLPGSATTYTDPNPGSGSHAYAVIATIGPDDSPPSACVLIVSTVSAISMLECEQLDGDVELTWQNNGGVFSPTYDSIEVNRNGVLVATLPGTTTSYIDVDAMTGTATYTLTASIGSDSSAPTACTLTVFDTDVTDLVLEFNDTAAGDTASAEAILQALTDSAQTGVLVSIDEMADLGPLGIDIGAFPRTWVELGTFPNNHTLTSSEGSALAAYVNAGGSIYLGGGDTFCFDTPTAIHALTGISGACGDGGFGIDTVEGVIAVDCALGEFEDVVTYAGEAGFVDQLAPLTTGQLVLEFTDSGAVHSGGVYNQVGGSVVISQSVELGGIGIDHDKQDLVSRYLNCFPVVVLPTPEFIRGDVNQDSLVDVTDAAALLEHLFLFTFMDDCHSSLDGNDDSAVDVADAAYILAHLFTFGPNPPAPFPGCGPEDTPDSLACDSFACP